MKRHSRPACLTGLLAGAAALAMGGYCSPVGPNDLTGVFGTPVSVERILLTISAPGNYTQQSRIEALQQLGLSESLAEYFVSNHQRLAGLNQPIDFSAAANNTIEEGKAQVFITNSNFSQLIFVTINGINVSHREEAWIGPGERVEWTVEQGRYEYRVESQTGALRTTGKENFLSGTRYTWSTS